MNKEEAIRFAGLMEDYLHIPSFVCEMIQDHLENNNYKEVVEYVIQRRNEIENKEDYISEQQAINMWINKIKEKDKEISRLNNDIKILLKENEAKENVIKKQDYIINELEKIWKEQQEHYRYYKDNRYRTFLSKNLDKLKELKGEDNEKD